MQCTHKQITLYFTCLLSTNTCKLSIPSLQLSGIFGVVRASRCCMPRGSFCPHATSGYAGLRKLLCTSPDRSRNECPLYANSLTHSNHRPQARDQPYCRNLGFVLRSVKASSDTCTHGSQHCGRPRRRTGRLASPTLQLRSRVPSRSSASLASISSPSASARRAALWCVAG